MGFKAKIQGLRGIPDWVDEEVNNLVITDNGELLKRNNPSNETIYEVTTDVTGITGTTPTEITELEFDLEEDTWYQISFLIYTEILGIDSTGGGQIVLSFDGSFAKSDFTGTSTSSKSGPTTYITGPFNRILTGNYYKTASGGSGTAKVKVNQVVNDVNQSISVYSDSVVIVRKIT